VAPAVPALRPLHARARRLPAALGPRSTGLCAMKTVQHESASAGGLFSRESVSHCFALDAPPAQNTAGLRALLAALASLVRSHLDLDPANVLLLVRVSPHSRPTQSA